ncbi:MAG TPA: rhodanese-like domain-containing protein, partial [Thermomicrobiales bacterium]|nr:rhodanese-like domain-containing protein [Thermomicrobiales bacterium]
MHTLPGNSITRRGLLVGGLPLATAAAIRARPSHVDAIQLPADRGFANDPLLLSATAVQTQLTSDPGMQVLDASRRADFLGSHIPGARHVWWQDTMELNAHWYGQVLKSDDDQGNQGRRIHFLEHLGIESSRPVVVYDRTDGQAAARVCWFLTFLGLQASVLDGGFRAWIGTGGATRNGLQSVTKSSAPQVRPQEGFYLLSETTAARLVTAPGQLIDLRTASERMQGAGAKKHVPGAVWLDRSTLLDKDQVLKDRSGLDQLWAAAAIDTGQ